MLRLLVAYRGISACTPQQVHDGAGDTWELVITCAEGVIGDADLGGTLVFKDSLKRLALSEEGVCEGMEGVVECLEGLVGGRWEDAKGEEFLLSKVLSTWEAGSGDEVAAVECLRVNTHNLKAPDHAFQTKMLLPCSAQGSARVHRKTKKSTPQNKQMILGSDPGTVNAKSVFHTSGVCDVFQVGDFIHSEHSSEYGGDNPENHHRMQ